MIALAMDSLPVQCAGAVITIAGVLWLTRGRK